MTLERSHDYLLSLLKELVKLRLTAMCHFGHDMFSFDGHLIVQAFDTRIFCFVLTNQKHTKNASFDDEGLFYELQLYVTTMEVL